MTPQSNAMPGDMRGATCQAAMSAAGIAHDLGNLIQIASSAINVIIRSVDMPPVHRDPLLSRARSSLEQAGALVRQTIGAMRDEVLAIEDVNVAASLADIEDLVLTAWDPATRVSLDVALDLLKVRCDRLGLQNAVMNLLLNARDAITERGAISIQARTVRHGLGQPEVELRVTDNGVGMSRETIARAFEPFFTTKSDGLGGVGLPMVARFIEQVGGTIAIESKLGIGTVVTLRLPAIPSPEPERSEARSVESWGDDLSVQSPVITEATR